MKKLYLFVGLAIFFVIYLTAGIPFLINLVETRGVLVAFPVYLGIYAIFAYVVGGIAGKGPMALVLFVFGFLLADIWAPPIQVGMDGAIPPLASQQLASDVFFFTAFASMGLGITLSWWLTYLGVPLFCAAIVIMELKTRRISKFIPNVML